MGAVVFRRRKGLKHWEGRRLVRLRKCGPRWWWRGAKTVRFDANVLPQLNWEIVVQHWTIHTHVCFWYHRCSQPSGSFLPLNSRSKLTTVNDGRPFDFFHKHIIIIIPNGQWVNESSRETMTHRILTLYGGGGGGGGGRLAPFFWKLPACPQLLILNSFQVFNTWSNN